MMLRKLKKGISPAGRSSVMVIAVLLLGSASLRLVTSASGAFAQDGQLPNTALPASAEITQAGIEADDAQRLKSMPVNRDEMSNLIQALTKREAQIVERERQLDIRVRALTIADDEIEKRLQLLTQTEESLRATLSLADKASEKDIDRLTSVYESMKPKDAAALFEEMEPNFAAGFLARMRADAAAAVLAGLTPQAAYSISVILAGRNATVPKT